MQKKVAEQVAFAFTYLFHEVHQPVTPTSQHQKPIVTPNSPQHEITSRKLFSESLKKLLIFMINVIDLSD